MVDLRMAGLRPGPRSFAALIDACRVGGQPAKALDIFQASVAFLIR
jgi:pentatricopeptide repeat protein